MRVTYESDPAEKYLALNWGWRFDRVMEDGECFFVATVAEIPDFRAFGETKEEVAGNARDALLSHLRGYLNTGKSIPVPGRVTNIAFEPSYRAVAGR